MVKHPDANLPHFGPESRMVRDSRVEPSTLRLNITDSPYLRREPSTLKADIEDGSMTRAGPSMLTLHIADGSILQDRTLHAKARSRRRSSLPKISENQVEYQQSDEAEDKGVGGMFLVAVSVGLGDHFVADHIEHCPAGEGQHHRQ